MNNDDTKPQVAVHRAQIGMPPEMFRGLKIMAAEQGTSVTALVIAAVEQVYPEVGQRK